jgi:hypothetical protein
VALPSPRIVNAAAPIARPFVEQRILWPTFHGHGDGGGSDSGAFPRLTAIKARRTASPPEALAAFVEAVWMAQDHILVLDDYLFEPEGVQSPQIRYEQILFWLTDGLGVCPSNRSAKLLKGKLSRISGHV